MLRKLFVCIIILPFIGGYCIPSSIIDLSSEELEIYGSLSGYVTDHEGNPIDTAKITITCEDFIFECFSDDTGYYYQGDIPLLFCIWNISAFKPEYKIVYVNIPIEENSTYDFVLKQTDKACLSGYILDSYRNPIEGAKVTITCADTFECISDNSGYYIRDNLPLLFCIWNVSVSKQGYGIEYIEMPIVQNTIYDFILIPIETENGIILLLAFPTEFHDYETNYTFMCPGRGHGVWITPSGVSYQKICGAVLQKDKFFGLANSFIILGVKVR